MDLVALARTDPAAFVALLADPKDLSAIDLGFAAELALEVREPSPAGALMKLLEHPAATVRAGAAIGAEGHTTWAMHAVLVRASVLDADPGVRRYASESAGRMYRRLAR